MSDLYEIQSLVSTLSSVFSWESQRTVALNRLCCLAAANSINGHTMINIGAIPILIDLLKSDIKSKAAYASTVLTVLSGIAYAKNDKNGDHDDTFSSYNKGHGKRSVIINSELNSLLPKLLGLSCTSDSAVNLIHSLVRHDEVCRDLLNINCLVPLCDSFSNIYFEKKLYFPEDKLMEILICLAENPRNRAIITSCSVIDKRLTVSLYCPTDSRRRLYAASLLNQLTLDSSFALRVSKQHDYVGILRKSLKDNNPEVRKYSANSIKNCALSSSSGETEIFMPEVAKALLEMFSDATNLKYRRIERTLQEKENDQQLQEVAAKALLSIINPKVISIEGSNLHHVNLRKPTNWFSNKAHQDIMKTIESSYMLESSLDTTKYRPVNSGCHEAVVAILRMCSSNIYDEAEKELLAAEEELKTIRIKTNKLCKDVRVAQQENAESLIHTTIKRVTECGKYTYSFFKVAEAFFDQLSPGFDCEDSETEQQKLS